MSQKEASKRYRDRNRDQGLCMQCPRVAKLKKDGTLGRLCDMHWQKQKVWNRAWYRSHRAVGAQKEVAC